MIARRGGPTLIELDRTAASAGTKEIITVDCSNPREIDDGITVTPLATAKELYRVGVYIVDTTPLLQKPTVIREVLEKTEAKYLKDQNGEEHYLPMIPPKYVGAMDFTADEPRKALEITFVIGKKQQPTDLSVGYANVVATTNFEYAKFGNKCHSDKDFHKFARGAELILSQLGVAAYGGNLPAQAILEGLKHKKWRRGKQLISPYMIAANYLVGNLMAEANFEFLYRVMDPNDQARAAFLPPEEACYSKFPGIHSELGLYGVGRVTSPLRRAEDFINHGVIKAYLKGRPLTAHEHKLIDITLRNLNQREVRLTRNGLRHRDAEEQWFKKKATNVLGVITSAENSGLGLTNEDSTLALPA